MTYWNKKAFESEFGKIGNFRKKASTNSCEAEFGQTVKVTRKRKSPKIRTFDNGEKGKFSISKTLNVLSKLEDISQNSFVTKEIIERESRKLNLLEFDLLMNKISNNNQINFI